MLSSVLRSPRAVEVNIAIMRTFVQLRRLMDSNRQLARKIEALEKKYDEQRRCCVGMMSQTVTSSLGKAMRSQIVTASRSIPYRLAGT
jgi:hypothetical protein